MDYVSIDIETTGLDPLRDQILEVAMIADSHTNTGELSGVQRFHTYVTWKRIEGDPFALARNAKIIERIVKRESGYQYTEPLNLIQEMNKWLDFVGIGNFNPAGKNFSSFDRNFLLEHDETDIVFRPRVRHRALDPAPYYLIATDVKLPSLEECLARANFEATDLHTALGDAWDVCRLLRKALVKFL